MIGAASPGIELVGRLLGVDDLESIEAIRPAFAAPWAHAAPAWVFLGFIAFCALAAVFYFRIERRGSRKIRAVLAAGRALLLSILFMILSEPILTIHLTTHPRPALWVLFDGTESMAIVDEIPEAERARLHAAAGLPARGASEDCAKVPRIELVRSLVRKTGDNLLARLSEKHRVRAFVFDRPDGVRSLEAASGLDLEALSRQLTAEGQVSALGAAFEDLARRHVTGNLSGILTVSDFDQNAGPPAVPAAKKLGVPVYTLGLGPATAVDLAVDLQAPLLMKKAERSILVATLRHGGLDGRSVRLKVTAHRAGDAGEKGEAMIVAETAVQLSASTVPVEVPYAPEETGRFFFTAEVEVVEGEIVDQNNRSEREVLVRDDFLRLMFVEYEPTWEWRFIKEVFHRDKLVGMRGFRTFLRSADPKVRHTNELFLPTLTPQRSEFFSNDVIFLGDMPAATLSTRFCEMVKEFVSKFGGGLVVMAGPRFGPSQLGPLADMLPVVIDPDARIRDERPFRLRFTPESSRIDILQLGESPDENERAWGALGQVPWYQPVARPHPMATILAEHPADTCVDGKTPQPLLAIRRYGKGEVIYLGFNETWRLRRKFGEKYYRRFWGQMIHRLGLSHALGSQKRFVVRTDRRQYQADEKVIVTVEAYDANFEPLSAEKLPERKLSGEVILPGRKADGGEGVQPFGIPELREGVFEARVPVAVGGEHRIKVKDPITGEQTEVHFQVTNVSAERRSAVRNAALEREIAAETGGQTYDLGNVSGILDAIERPVTEEKSVKVFPLWNTWAFFGIVVFLMLGEWLIRKLVNLP